MSKMCSLNFFDDVIHHLVKDPFTDSLIFVEAFVEVPRGDAQESLEVEAAGSQESPEAVEAWTLFDVFDFSWCFDALFNFCFQPEIEIWYQYQDQCSHLLSMWQYVFYAKPLLSVFPSVWAASVLSGRTHPRASHSRPRQGEGKCKSPERPGNPGNVGKILSWINMEHG